MPNSLNSANLAYMIRAEAHRLESRGFAHLASFTVQAQGDDGAWTIRIADHVSSAEQVVLTQAAGIVAISFPKLDLAQTQLVTPPSHPARYTG